MVLEKEESRPVEEDSIGLSSEFSLEVFQMQEGIRINKIYRMICADAEVAGTARRRLHGEGLDRHRT